MKIEPLSHTTIEAIIQCQEGNGWKSDSDVWSQILREHEQRKRLVLVAMAQGEVTGYGSLLWRSAYPPFASADIPEIHDLVVARALRGRGIARKLIAEFERTAAVAGRRFIGLGVGLYADYGAAQRLYMSLGYLPDGRGVTYRHQPVEPGASVRADDDLVLWLAKDLSAERS